jgi:exopolysaccharide biosynthesis polyprenyl glycosylphosphotransferase
MGMKQSRYKIVLAIIDYCLLFFSLLISIELKGIVHNTVLPEWNALIFNSDHIGTFIYLFAVLLVFQNYQLYKINVVVTQARQFVQLTISFFYATIGLAVAYFFFNFRLDMHLRIVSLYFIFIGLSIIAFYRIFIFRPLFIYFSKQKTVKRRILIVGAALEAKNFIIQSLIDNLYGFEFIGFIDDHYKNDEVIFENIKNLGKLHDLPRIVKNKNIDEILITISDVSTEKLLEIVDLCKTTKANIQVASPILEIIHKKIFSEKYFDVPIAKFSNNSESRVRLSVKRIIDIVLSILGMLVFLIPFVIISILIKATSQGPIFFRQARVGKNGKSFVFYKFRSMYMGSENDDKRKKHMESYIRQNGKKGSENKSTKIVNEERITNIGAFLRKTSIDEMPQLFNVLKGDMSMVGPRPCLKYEYEAYDDWHKRRMSVMPGCTGLWQVTARSKSNFEEMVLLDIYYIENMSIWFDLQLILKTVPVMLFQKGGK